MISITKRLIIAVAIAVGMTCGTVSAAIPITADVIPGISGEESFLPAIVATSNTSTTHSIMLASSDGETGHKYDPAELERQSKLLAPKEGDNTRIYLLGGLGVIVACLFVLVAINRKKWGSPTA